MGMPDGDCVQPHRMQHFPNSQAPWSERTEQPDATECAIRDSKLQGPKICHVLALRPKPIKTDTVFQFAPAIIGHAQPRLATAQNAPSSPWIPISKTEEWLDCRVHILRQKIKLPLESRLLHAVGQRLVSLHQFFHHLCRRDNRVDLAADLANLQFTFL